MGRPASLCRVLAECEFPDFNGHIRTLRFPVIHPASLRFASLGSTTCYCGSFRIFRRHRKPDDGPRVCIPVSQPDLHAETTGPPRFPGNPNIHLHMFFDPGRTIATNQNAATAWLPLKRKRKLQREILFRGSIAWLLDSLCTLRSAGYPDTTQYSLPAAGQALPGEIDSLGSDERFQVVML